MRFNRAEIWRHKFIFIPRRCRDCKYKLVFERVWVYDHSYDWCVCTTCSTKIPWGTRN